MNIFNFEKLLKCSPKNICVHVSPLTAYENVFFPHLNQLCVLLNILGFANQKKMVSSCFNFNFFVNINMFLSIFAHFNSEYLLNKDLCSKFLM